MSLSDQDVLDKAVGRAKRNGWRGFKGWLNFGEHPNDTLFDKSFAEALWPGKTRVSHSCDYPKCDTLYDEVPLADYHRQRMVVAEDPIAYLGQNI